MIGDSFGGVLFRGVMANEEGPIAGLRKEKRSHELAQDTFVIRSHFAGARFCQRSDARVRGKKVRVNPAAFLIQPDIKETLITPARHCRVGDLFSRILRQKLARCCQQQLVFCSRENDVLKEDWSLKPPMPEQFSVEWRDHEGV